MKKSTKKAKSSSKKKPIIITIAILFLLAAFGSCGEDKDTAETPAAPPATMEETFAPETTAEPTTAAPTMPETTVENITEPAAEASSETTPEAATSAPSETTAVPTEEATTEAPSTEARETFSMYASESVNVRSGPGSGYSRLGSFQRNDVISVYDNSGEWAEIDYNGTLAYVHSSYLSNTEVSTLPAPVPETEAEEVGGGPMVWIPATGSKYHSRSSCSNMKNPTHVPLETAIKRGYEPCKKCY